MQNMKYFFLAVAIIMIIFVFYALIKAPNGLRHALIRTCLVLIGAGAVGNMIDRLTTEYVVDFFYFRLINFPIFNVADIYVTCATFLLVIILLFVYKDNDLRFLNLRSDKFRTFKDKNAAAQAENAATKAEDAAAQGDNSSSKADDAASKSEDAASKSEDAATKAEDAGDTPADKIADVASDAEKNDNTDEKNSEEAVDANKSKNTSESEKSDDNAADKSGEKEESSDKEITEDTESDKPEDSANG